MIILKEYQLRVLASLKQFLRQCALDGYPDAAFRQVLEGNGSPLVPYLPVHTAGLEPEMPYVCLRVPTGGGKTLLACYAAGLAMTELLHADRVIVLWLVPSNTILDQTANALRDARHPYRRALESSCGPVEVFTIQEALHMSRGAAEGQTAVVISTIQSFRVEDTTGRKVYEQNGAFLDHFQNVPASRLDDLFRGADGNPQPSLVNMLRLRRPVVIVDEAHNARTDLSFSTLGNVKPSCIIEFTATPAREKSPSNVLHYVSAAELKAADMVKLPLRVVARPAGQQDQLLADALALRADLEKLADAEGQATGEYLRPILLLQADRVDACEPLREKLVSDYGLKRDAIKISVGKLDELKDVKDITSPQCPVRVILTVEKLREGWDCPFAYVLCSLKETRSATAIEQIVGRILRLPKAEAKHHPDLNCSYAFSVSPQIELVLDELTKALESNGFTREEAKRIVIPVIQPSLAAGSQPQTVRLSSSAEIDQFIAGFQAPALTGKVLIDTSRGEITINSTLSKDELEILASCLKTPEAKAKVTEAAAAVRDAEKAWAGAGKHRQLSPYEQGLEFRVPLLCVQENGNLFEFESTFLIEHPWRLSDKDASLPESYDPMHRPLGETGALDVNVRGGVEATVGAGSSGKDFIGNLHQQVLAFNIKDDWTLERLIAWLDRHIDHRDITASESAVFIRKAIRGYMTRSGNGDIELIARDRFRLRQEIETRIQAHRRAERYSMFQQLLMADSLLRVTDQHAISFRAVMYEPSWLYAGSFQFQKHYYPPGPGELTERRQDGKLTEEFRCAQYLDRHPRIAFWVRNLVRKPSSFRLQTSTDWFYPDFVCQLTDGRVLVVEYKGKHLEPGAEEKRAVGAVWASRSNGRCLFAMPTAMEFGEIDEVIGPSSH